ncbi:N-acetylmuramoyl-L-alanine amidase [Maribacter phage Molly_5]|uniref:N-acetylmuramoyl-L-alanine amidase n=2 Tax=Mollyvirus TaxID=2948826 RepID=A0A8E4UY21_9CAUD|nr:endolysin [Maribacter phage Molly_1]YP_010357313.1 endolysin [Maribacter phage Colly_1]QQO97751.1 N-acetylmuramoyl-L-alanine amidase [Maribacter phage Molly_2]QQO97951.1 N-acetylmuramoyl-L-alanine amidase [Maribacter phage Molly_3]QQO98151.1 N-acetylmuramoyl-L-alanine amidase [Maribacter phage Molly_4]QQO98351.1 N-acetylmuramoyl-L-alanine amidase [Maribacter phage Molly_5]QQO97349.1 N-acetylmuramoyl-L-alanine amidase [Maribacter phage Colly_1]
MIYKPMFDNGHGSVINGIYQTPGKRSPNWECGTVYEGQLNRVIVNGVIRLCMLNNIPYYHVSPELTDVGLDARVNRANKIYAVDRSAYLLSIHFNAGGGTGIEGFTSKGETKSDPICNLFLSNYEEVGEKMRYDYSDGDKDKEAGYYVLTRTNCPAALMELGFMDNKADYLKMWDTDHLDKLINSTFKTVEQLYRGSL